MAAESNTKTLAETENFAAWTIEEDGEITYHIEFGQVTMHFFREEWDELIALLDAARRAAKK
jgi:hypothetical protein